MGIDWPKVLGNCPLTPDGTATGGAAAADASLGPSEGDADSGSVIFFSTSVGCLVATRAVEEFELELESLSIGDFGVSATEVG